MLLPEYDRSYRVFDYMSQRLTRKKIGEVVDVDVHHPQATERRRPRDGAPAAVPRIRSLCAAVSQHRKRAAVRGAAHAFDQPPVLPLQQPDHPADWTLVRVPLPRRPARDMDG